MNISKKANGIRNFLIAFLEGLYVAWERTLATTDRQITAKTNDESLRLRRVRSAPYMDAKRGERSEPRNRIADGVLVGKHRRRLPDDYLDDYRSGADDAS
jgi:hypothetical protein